MMSETYEHEGKQLLERADKVVQSARPLINLTVRSGLGLTLWLHECAVVADTLKGGTPLHFGGFHRLTEDLTTFEHDPRKFWSQSIDRYDLYRSLNEYKLYVAMEEAHVSDSIGLLNRVLSDKQQTASFLKESKKPF